MGQEIVYCSKCRIQLRSPDFEKEKAYRINGVIACLACARDIVHSLPPATIQQLLHEVADKEEAGEKRQSSTSRILRISETSAHKLAAPRRSRILVPMPGVSGGIVAVVVVGLLALVAALASSSSGSRTTRRADPSPVADGNSPSVPSVPAPADAPKSAGAFDEEAGESLRQARAFAKSHPEDFAGQVKLYEKALWDAGGTSLVDPARRELDEIRKRDREGAAKDLPGLIERARGAASKEEFGRALQILKEGRGRHLGTDWTDSVDKTSQEIRGQAVELYRSLKETAISAALKGAADEAKLICERIGRWNLEDCPAEPEKVLSSATRTGIPSQKPLIPKAERSPESIRIGKAWETSMILAQARDFAAASREMEELAAATQDPIARKEITTDVEILAAVAGLHKESFQVLAGWPKEKKLSVRYLDELGAPSVLEAEALRLEGSRLELKHELGLATVECGELVAGTLAEAVKSRRPPNSTIEPRTLGLFFLLEGDPAAARTLMGDAAPSIPDKYWNWAERSRESLPSEREGRARKMFHQAERDYGAFASRADAVLRFRALQSEFADTSFVRRNSLSIAQRSESPKEYVFPADALRAEGSFLLSEGKPGACWTSSFDSGVSSRKQNLVELEFSAFPEVAYRCWVYVGGCCAETLACFVQGTEMKWSPGAEAAASIAHGLGSSPRTHASHGGAKQPSRWGWVEAPLPKYSWAGRKVLRVLTDQKGFSVAFAVVSSVRQSPPKESEFKDLFKPSSVGSLEAGLVGYWRFDEGKGQAAASLTPQPLNATLVNGPIWTAGRLGGALTFSANACLTVIAQPKLTDLGPLTLSAWIKPTGLELGRVIAKEEGSKGRWMLVAGKSGVIFACSFAGQELRRITAPDLLPLGKWSHLAATWDGSGQASQVRIYVNGAEHAYTLNQDGLGARLSDEKTPFYIGNRWDFTRGFSGVIDEVRIYRRVLGTREIVALAQPTQK